jgi:hypothetical protein
MAIVIWIRHEHMLWTWLGASKVISSSGAVTGLSLLAGFTGFSTKSVSEVFRSFHRMLHFRTRSRITVLVMLLF